MLQLASHYMYHISSTREALGLIDYTIADRNADKKSDDEDGDEDDDESDQ